MSQDIGNRASMASPTRVSSLFHNVNRPLKMIIATPGVLSSLCFIDDGDAKYLLEPHEVEIKALAYALDTNDVDVMLGSSGDSKTIGECAGVITALGSDLTHSFPDWEAGMLLECPGRFCQSYPCEGLLCA
ncbi:hypothetical protein BJ170DRAFT_641069 [Xylariales sp. AK1849]|nr:hypothetical protein BJ170DRAFT_641069 [Xylariales sp. AK1849]